MGDRRKLHGEIDRCLKKVAEGVEIFEDVWQKVHSAPNHNQKDKYEQELKKEIKKLQRLRDQIKGWMSSTEIKDKSSLQEARKNIEQQMERFKVVEREMKTKAYSKEGLDAGQKLDPREKEKEDCTQWITEAIQALERQVDKFEADIELLSVTLKKRRTDKDKHERLDDTKRSMERNKFHIKSLEKILRAIDNDAVDLKPIHNLRADIEYYIESNQESDFKENDMMYEEIDMDNLTTIMGPVLVAPGQSHPSSASNSNGSSLTSNTGGTLMDISAPMLNIPTSIINSLERTVAAAMTSASASNSIHGDGESVMGMTTPSSTQPSSPSASPAHSSTDDQKGNKFESDDHYSHATRSNAGTNGSSAVSLSHFSSPKNPSTYQQSPTVTSSGKALLSSVSNHSTSVPLHFTYPLSSSTSPSAVAAATTTATATTTTMSSTQPILPYSAIVSHNTAASTSTTTTSGNSTSKQQQHVLSPPTRQFSRQLSANNNETTTTTTSTFPNSSVTSSSSNNAHPSSPLVISNDRSGSSTQHTLNNNSHVNNPSSTTASSSTVTLANGTTIPSSLYSGAGPTLTNTNIPLEPTASTNTSLEPSMNSQGSPSLVRTITENDRPTGQVGSHMTNGLSDGHGLLDGNTFPNLLPPPSLASSSLPAAATTTTTTTTPSASVSSAFLPPSNLADPLSTNGGFLSQASSEPYSLLYPSSSSSSSFLSSNQASIQNNRVALTTAEQRMLTRLNSAYTKLPSLLESERQRTNANRIYGRNPLGSSQIIPYYPQIPPTGSDAPEFYYRLAPDTLFFVFYYMEGTRAQYLAAKALKRQSWRFHTKHMMWFQRHEEPKAITDDYEQGTYIFFDYERWQTRKRENFMFEYKFLEDREF